VGGRFEFHVLVRHAVGTPEIAGIGQGNPEVIMYASEGVFDHVVQVVPYIQAKDKPIHVVTAYAERLRILLSCLRDRNWSRIHHSPG
jgi:hypothetical protein